VFGFFSAWCQKDKNTKFRLWLCLHLPDTPYRFQNCNLNTFWGDRPTKKGGGSRPKKRKHDLRNIILPIENPGYNNSGSKIRIVDGTNDADGVQGLEIRPKPPLMGSRPQLRTCLRPGSERYWNRIYKPVV